MILNQTAYLGRGAIDNIADEVTGRGFTKVLVVTDKGLVSAGIVDRVLAVLDRAHLDYVIYDDVTPNPTAGGNPRPASRDQLEELYRSIY